MQMSVLVRVVEILANLRLVEILCLKVVMGKWN